MAVSIGLSRADVSLHSGSMVIECQCEIDEFLWLELMLPEGTNEGNANAVTGVASLRPAEHSTNQDCAAQPATGSRADVPRDIRRPCLSDAFLFGVVPRNGRNRETPASIQLYDSTAKHRRAR